MTANIRHACSICVGGAGILIEGGSGSGKTSLMFGLVERLTRCGVEARIVSDDQTRLDVQNDRLVVSAPQEIAGKAELRGFGVLAIDTARSAKLVLAVKLVGDQEIERMPEPDTCELLGIHLPLLSVPARHEEAAGRIVIAWIRENLIPTLPFPCA